MLDTVILAIPWGSAMKLPPAGPESPNWELHSRSKSFEKWVINETRKMKRDGVYRPRVRGVVRGKTRMLYIEFSAPKLFFGNNVAEVFENDFHEVISVLSKRLRDFGLGILTRTLESAEVSTFHPSKNIVLSKGYTASFVINELRRINVSKKLDLTRVGFRNDGQALQLYANSHSLVFYDKIRDLNKPKKRAIDKDQPPHQPSLFDVLKLKEMPSEILRIEVRLSKKVKMNAVLNQVGFKQNPTFRDIFKKEVCQKVVQSYWNIIIHEENHFLFSMTSNPQKVLQKVLISCPTIKAKQAIYMAGLYILAKDEGGIRHLRGIIEPVSQRRGWYRVAEDFKQLSVLQGLTMHNWVNQVDSQIERFEPLKLPT